MRLIAINGSPRGASSNTNKIVKEILRGAKDNGAETESIFLSDLNIKHCRGCFCCWLNNNSKCIIEDDMNELLHKYTQAQVVIYASPLFMDNITSILKTFMDRCIAVISPFMEKDGYGEYRHIKSNLFKTPKFVVVSNGAFPESSQFQVVSHYFQRLARSMHTEVIAEIYRGQGLMLALPRYAKDRHVIDNFNQFLYMAGQEIVKYLELSEETKTNINMPLVSYEKYVDNLDKYWKKALDK